MRLEPVRAAAGKAHDATSAGQACPVTTEADSANRRSAPRQQPVTRGKHEPGRRPGDGIFQPGQGLDHHCGLCYLIIHAVTEQRDGASVIRMIRIAVQRRVELRADGEQAKRPNSQCTKDSRPAQRWRRHDAESGSETAHGHQGGHRAVFVKAVCRRCVTGPWGQQVEACFN
jgi:hypothetical protein